MIEDLLIVEDSIEQRGLIVETMLKHCTSIREAGRLSEALSSIRDKDPDAVMLDLILPDSRDPLQTLAAVRMATTSAVIVVSSIGDGELIARAIRDGIAGWYVKGDWINLPYEVMRAFSAHRHDGKLSQLETDFFKI